MKKINIGKRPFIYPMPMTLVGAIVNSKPNFMPVAWVAPVNNNPPMIAVAMGNMHYTNIGIKEQKVFSICIPGRKIMDKVDYCGLTTGKIKDKSKLFSVYYEDNQQIPLINECPVCIQVKLEQTVELPSNDLFIGSIINTFADESCMTGGNPDVKKIDPFSLTMPDNQYWSIGEVAGKAWNVGYNIKKP